MSNRTGFFAGACLFALNSPALAQPAESVIVTGERLAHGDAPSQDITAANAAVRINAVNSEDLLRYAPDLLVRKRHIGDTQDPVATRTSGLGQSARSLIFADGILLSSPIGNNNSAASPHWGLVSPQDVSRVDILYGPFSAGYAGGSMGAVINITTRMPQEFQISGKALGAYQGYSLYGTQGDYGSYQLQAEVGDRIGDFAWRLSLNHLDSNSQPLSIVTVSRPSTASGLGTPVTGGIADLNRTGAPIAVIGSGGFEHQIQDTPTLKASYDLPGARLSYTASLFHQDDTATVESYLRDASGAAVYSGSVNLGGYNYSIPVTAFSNNYYHLNQTYLAQGLSLKSTGEGPWIWDAIASRFDYLSDNQRVPGVAIPLAQSGGAGSITRMTGTAWTTADASLGWTGGNHVLRAGLHDDVVTLDLGRYNTANWIDGAPGALASATSKGRTQTMALWLEDAWSFAPDWKAALGLRLENWRAYDGRNEFVAPPLDVTEPGRSGNFASPKAALSWQADDNWKITASYGTAFRMPTVTELYQAVTTGPTLTSPNPDLRPEHADSYDLSATYAVGGSRVRASLFEEDLSDALISQTALLSGSVTPVSYVQNIDRVRSRGAEIVADQKDVLVPGLDLQTSVTYLESIILRDKGFVSTTGTTAVGKNTPNLPKWRAVLSATYHATDHLDLSAAVRYQSRLYATIDNTDTNTHTWQGFDSFVVADVRARYRVDDNWAVAFGIDNINNDKYFLFHPFPQRSYTLELSYAQ